MTVGRIERLFMSQHEWEHGNVGSHCLDNDEKIKFFEKQQFVLQYFLGFLKINPQSRECHYGVTVTTVLSKGIVYIFEPI